MNIKPIIRSRLNSANKNLGEVLKMKMDVHYLKNTVKHTLIFEKETKEVFESIENSSEYITLLKAKIPKHVANGELLYLGLQIDFTSKSPDKYEAIIKHKGQNTTFTNTLNF
jgi:hypothetical protein